MGFVRSVGVRLLVLAAALVGTVVIAPSAHATEAPGVYDITTDRTIYPAAGTMTVTWRTAVPAGADDGFSANCTLTVNGVQQSPIECLSGQPFTYPDSGFRGADLTNSSVTVTSYYATSGGVAPTAISATKSIQFDGGVPTAGVSGFNTFDVNTSQAGPAVSGPMKPGSTYQATLVWHDNLHIQSTNCRLERASTPGVMLAPASCGSTPSQSGAAAVFTTPSSSGTYLYVVKVTDPAGNTAQGSRQFTVDATAPVLSFSSGPVEGSATSATSISWAWTVDEAATYKCWAGDQGANSTLTSCSSPFTAGGLGEGAKQLQIQATDGFGNTGITTVNFTVDRTKPTLTLSSPTDGATFTSPRVPFSLSASEPVNYQCSNNPDAGPASYVTCGSGWHDHWAGSITASGYGTYHYGFKAVDAAGNVSDPVTFTYTIAHPDAVLTWQSGPSGGATTKVVAPSWTWSSNASGPSYECSLQPSGSAPVFSACSSPYIVTSALADGAYELSVRTSGSDVTTSTAVVTFTVDGTSPTSGSVHISGTARVGSQVSAAGSWPSGVALAYQWQRDGSPIAGASHPTYRLTPADLKHRISATVVGTRGSHAVPVTTTAVTVIAGILSSGRPRITGVLKVGRTLIASASPWTAGTTVRYQWFANGRKIAGATGARLKVNKRLAGKRLKVTITGRRSGYQARVLTAARPGVVRR